MLTRSQRDNRLQREKQSRASYIRKKSSKKSVKKEKAFDINECFNLKNQLFQIFQKILHQLKSLKKCCGNAKSNILFW